MSGQGVAYRAGTFCLLEAHLSEAGPTDCEVAFFHMFRRVQISRDLIQTFVTAVFWNYQNIPA